MKNSKPILQTAKETILLESSAIANLANLLDKHFENGNYAYQKKLAIFLVVSILLLFLFIASEKNYHFLIFVIPVIYVFIKNTHLLTSRIKEILIFPIILSSFLIFQVFYLMTSFEFYCESRYGEEV